MEAEKKHTIYTLGYQGLEPAALKRVAEKLDLAVLDIRFSARSRNPTWASWSLQTLLGHHYVPMPELGNVNYKNGGPIRLSNPTEGLAHATTYLNTASVVLLCVCPHLAECHRLVAATLLAEATGAPLVHWSLADVLELSSEDSRQQSLF